MRLVSFKNAMLNILALALLSFSACDETNDIGDQAFLPLMRMKVHIGGRLAEFNETVDDFAVKKGFTVSRGGYPTKGEQEVSVFELYAKSNSKKNKTFFSFSNRRDSQISEGAIYSNQDEKTWKILWNQFVDTMRNAFGTGNVEIYKEN